MIVNLIVEAGLTFRSIITVLFDMVQLREVIPLLGKQPAVPENERLEGTVKLRV